MKKTLLIMFIGMFIAGPAELEAAAGEIEGNWIARVKDDRVSLTLVIERDYYGRSGTNQTTHSIDLDEFGRIPSDGEYDRKIEREAGLLSLDGEFRDSKGMGFFSFTPSDDFEDYLDREDIGRADDEEMLHLFLADVDREYVEGLQKLGYDPSLNDLVALSIHGVDAEYIKEIKEDLGFRRMSLDDLLAFKIHGISKEYISELKEIGLDDLSEDEVLSMKIHGISADYVKEMQDAGFDMPADELLSFKIHGVTPEFAEKMNDLTGERLGHSELLQMKIHGVTPDYIDAMRKAGFEDVPVSKLVQFRIHGVTPEFIEKMEKCGFRDLSPSDLVTFRIHGVSPEFVREVEDMGFTGLDASDFVQMRIHGVSAEFVREIRDAGFEDISLDELVRFKIHGVDADYIRYVRKLAGDKKLTARKIVSMRIHGI
ncbi:MAG TPA: hypothetical protein VLA34_08180 [Candidatus Krumholzibacterium sp.]|nr:hypothetical protein [Candidatus Krumholzibacterium sp.]